MPPSMPTDKPRFLSTVRELVRCYQAFERYSDHQIRRFGLTPAQFDLIATLGNTAGLSPKALVEKTLITKGTLTGVIDRLEARKLVKRHPNPQDGRSQIVRLTAAGEAIFNKTFPRMMAHLAQAFATLSAAEQARSCRSLQALRFAFEKQESV